MTGKEVDAILSALTRIADALDRIEGRLAREDNCKTIDPSPIKAALALSYDYSAAPSTTCIQQLRAQGKPYPRTCPTCGLGPCRHKINAIPPVPMNKSAVKFDADDAR